MPKVKSPKNIIAVPDFSENTSPGEHFNPDVQVYLESIGAAELNANIALRIAGCLISECIGASKNKMEQIKLMDKLLNSARAIIETKLKTEDYELLLQRLSELETKLSKILS